MHAPTQLLIHYIQHHFLYTFCAFVYLYILLQAFAIPGPIFLCLLSPTLFGPLPGFCLCITVLIHLRSVPVSVPLSAT